MRIGINLLGNISDSRYQFAGRFVAQHMGHRRIHVDVLTAGSALKDADDSIFEDSPVVFFSLPKGLFNLLPLSNVLLDGYEVSISRIANVSRYRCNRHLFGIGGSIFPPVDKLTLPDLAR